MTSSSSFQNPLGYLDRLEDGRNSAPCSRDNIHRLTVMIKILRPFVKCTLKWKIGDKNVQVRLQQIDDAVNKVIQDYQPLDSISAQVSANPELLLSNLKKLEVIKQDMKEIYSIVAVTTFTNMEFFRSIHTKNMFLPLKNFPKSIMSSLLSHQIFGRQEIVSMASYVVSFIDSLLEVLKDILRYKADFISPVEEQIEAFEEKLRFFRYFLWFIAKRCIKQRKLKDLWMHAEFVAVNVACLLYFCLVDDKICEIMVQEMRTKLVDLTEKINLLKLEGSELYLGALKNLRPSHNDTRVIDEHYLEFVDSLIDSIREQSKNQAILLFATEDQKEILLDELKLLRINLMDAPIDEYSRKARTLMVKTKAVINKTAYYFYFFYINEMNEDASGQPNLVLSGILEEIERIKEKATDWYHKFMKKSLTSKFPRTDELGFIEFIIKKLKEQLHHDEALICPFKHQIEIVYEELKSLRKDFSEMAEQLNGNEELNVLLEHFKDTAYQAEYVVDSLVARAAGSCWCSKLGLFVVTKEIRCIQRKLKAIRKKESNDTPAPVLSQANIPNNEAVPDSENEVGHKSGEATIQLVGFEVAVEKIKEQLTGGSKQLNVLSIVGMPGMGKTTLANSLYNDHSVTFSFHARAWCCVSQEFQKETLLQEILCQITGKSNQSSKINGKDYVENLYKSLKRKRYLIVIDDIWEIEAWNELKEIFPDDHNGSRILFTTRNQNVALRANSVTYSLSPLSDDQSWKLLHVKIFEEKSCPSELLQVGKRIAKKCKGLPLALVSIAGVLKTIERKKDRWEQVEESLWSKEPINPLEQHFGILELSYKHLPNNLKPCFLYFGAFPEDAVISVSKLLWLWIAEGFIHQPNSSQISLETEAGSYLKDLIDRSLVMVARRSSRGGVKSCHVHDLLRDFCLAKAEEENFLLHIQRYDQLSTTSADSVKQQAYRLCIDKSHKYHLRGSLRVRSLLFWRFWFFDELSLVNAIKRFRLLRVLDLSCILPVGGIGSKDFIKLSNLVHLRYLAIQIRWPWIPSQIGNLQNLETLIFIEQSTSSSYIELPITIWNLTKLRHLYVKNGYFTLFVNRSDQYFDNSFQLENLESISTIRFFHRNYFEKLMSRTPNLRKLSCTIKMLWDPLVIHLNQVEALKLHFEFEVKHPLQFHPPSNLKKLTLSNFRRPWDEISVIGELPNLEVLKLNEGAFVGRQWDMIEGEFQKLKFLKLCKLDIEIWNASSDHVPCLERLVLHSCLSLEEIPSSALEESSTLQLIEIKECRSSIKESVRQIQSEQRDMGIDQFQVHLYGP